MSGKIRALGLFSGGLDSVLAYKIMEGQGIDPIAVFFKTPFFSGARNVRDLARIYNIKLEEFDITKRYLEGVLRNPEYGYGRFFNPCIDCHGFMVRQAAGLLGKYKARFIFTGEVLGERPFSQTTFGLKKVAGLGHAERLLLRPLSAKLLPVTIPEEKGWVDRGSLYGIKGRGRKKQFELAGRYGINVKGLLQPSGGCLLTDPAISKRVRAYLKHFKNDENWIWPLIKTGRHFAPVEETAIVFGRNEEENEIISGYGGKGVLVFLEDAPGPVGIVFGRKKNDDEVLKLCAEVVFSYAKKGYNKTRVRFVFNDGKSRAIELYGRKGRREYDKWMLR